jgi:hypothetical protein
VTGVQTCALPICGNRDAPQVGNTLRVAARPGEAIWIYRNDAELLLVCPRDCQLRDGQLRGELTFDGLGRYAVVWLSTDRAPAPSGQLERDVAAASAAGATHEVRDFDVE